MFHTNILHALHPRDPLRTDKMKDAIEKYVNSIDFLLIWINLTAELFYS